MHTMVQVEEIVDGLIHLNTTTTEEIRNSEDNYVDQALDLRNKMVKILHDRFNEIITTEQKAA